MDTNCDFTGLPSLSCSHCSGADLDVKGFDIDHQSGLSTDWFTPGETKAEQLTSRISPSVELAESLQAQKPTTGRYNKTKEVYGGHDGQIEFEDVERADD